MDMNYRVGNYDQLNYGAQLSAINTEKKVSATSLGKEQATNAVGGDAAVMAISDKGIISSCQQKLSELGFYTGSINGNASTTEFKKAVSNFQKVYGLSVNGTTNSSTMNKINEAYTSYRHYYTSRELGDYANRYGLDNLETKNFALTAAFLKVGMGLSDIHAAAVLGNIHQESRFASDNAKDTYYKGDHNSDYVYQTEDKRGPENDQNVGYGLLQWTYRSRKETLRDTALEMRLSVSDVNAQLACIRKEMSGEYAGAWNDFLKTTDLSQATTVFCRRIEQPNGNEEKLDDRIAFAQRAGVVLHG